MADKVWKAVERKIARFFGTERAPGSGSSGKITASDTLHPKLFIEIKHRSKNAVMAWYRKAREKAKREKKIPVVALHLKSTHTWLIVCSVSDLPQVANFLESEVPDDEQWPLD